MTTQLKIASAIQQERKSIRIAGKKINLPSPQKHGTYTQQAMYVDTIARQLVEDLGLD